MADSSREARPALTHTKATAAFPSIIVFLLTALTLSACGSSIQNAQDFKPNEAPVVGEPSAVLTDGTAVNTATLISGQTIKISIPAYDPEGGDLSFQIESSYGSVKNRSYENGVFSFLFYTKNVAADTPVDITVTAADPKKSVTTLLYTVGSGKPVPKLSLAVSGKDSISSSEDTTVTMTSSGSGYYQFFCDNSVSSVSTMKQGMQYPLDANTDGSIPPVTFKVASLSSSTTDADVRLTVKGENKLWAVFKDPNGKIISASCSVTTADVLPAATYSATSTVVGTSVTATVTVTFNKEMDTASLTSAAAALGTAEGTITGRTVASKSLVFTITGLTTGRTYALTLAGCRDTEGTEIAQYTYTFTTVKQITGLALSADTANVRYGSTYQLSGTYTPSTALNKQTIWTSSDSSIASVDTNGLVTAINVGTAVITAKTEDNSRTASCSINVTGIITYYANGALSGTVPVDSNGYALSATVTAAANTGNLQKVSSVAGTSYCVKNWNTKADGTGTSYTLGGTFAMPNQNVVTLYAIWKPYAVGDTGPGGGIVFYDRGSYTTSGYIWRYMESSTVNQSPSILNCFSRNYYLSLFTSATAIGTGRTNTDMLIANDGVGLASINCRAYTANGYSDWFLPSLDELKEMYAQRAVIGVFSSTLYWSSSQNGSDSHYAYCVNFSTGATVNNTYVDTEGYCYRAIREF